MVTTTRTNWLWMNLKDQIAERNPDALFADGFDDALIGFTHNHCEPCRAIYSVHKCIDILMKDGASEEEALEYFSFNTLGAYVGKNGPLFASC